MKKHLAVPSLLAALFGLGLIPVCVAQAPAAASAPANCAANRGLFSGPAALKSVDPQADGRVTFRLCAPDATTVFLASTDLPGIVPFGANTPGLAMTRGSDGLWSVTTGEPVPPDNYRYNFLVNGAVVPDPQASTFSKERFGTRSTFEMPGAAGAFQTYDRNVPHGLVSVFEYWSSSLGIKRSAYVYLPPGYARNSKRYPVLYLVHGAGDSQDEWTSTGHAHYILDNLIAAGKARPMIIVMPAGHTPDRPGANMLGNQDFGNDLHKDLIPAIDATFRTEAKAQSRAMAGLSMGGAHTIQFGLPRPEIFRYVGVFSMGLGMGGNQDDIKRYEQQNSAALARSAKDMKLVYYAMGKEDFLYGTVAPTRAMLDRAGIGHMYNESGGGHTWINWRRYLADFAPRLFR
jgi:enterochelin esterase-like enzyme